MRLIVCLCVFGILCGCSSSYQKTFHTTAYCDKGSAIKGPQRLDLFFKSHNEALEWGRKSVVGTVER
ncbi:MAG: hypothetical protein LC645_03010 [Geobacteraceae bacterium]|nr:hypothetical protein [Geobacteraceae bacterium]